MRDSPRPFRGVPVDSGARHAGHLRGLNIDRVLNIAIDRPGTFTRAEIIEATGLSAPTVGSLTSDLIRTGVIRDLGTAPSRGGRRPGLMEFNARHAYIAGIDLGPTRTRLAVADLRGRTIARQIIATPSKVEPHCMLGQIAAALRALMQEASVPIDRLAVVVAGAPGAVNLETGTVDMAPNLNGWRRVPMLHVLQDELQTTVLIENDVNLALLGEHWQGAARGHDTCAFIFVGTGIGSAILIDGALHHGHSYMAGEIGVMCMAREYLEQDFGSRGCLEMLAGLDALRNRWPLEAQEDPAGWFATLLQRSQAGDQDAQRALAQTTDLIGIATANVAAVVDPSIIVLGGAMFAQAQPLVDAVRHVVQKIARTSFEVVLSALGKEAPLAGCLLIGAMEARRHLRQTLKVPVPATAPAVRRVQ